MMPKEHSRGFAHNKALYIIAEKSAEGKQGFIVAWHYDAVELGIAHAVELGIAHVILN